MHASDGLNLGRRSANLDGYHDVTAAKKLTSREPVSRNSAPTMGVGEAPSHLIEVSRRFVSRDRARPEGLPSSPFM